jgi:hypothetical protein
VRLEVSKDTIAPWKMQIRRQLEFQSPIPLQGQAPAVLLHQASRKAMAVVADQGVGAPVRHHLHVWVCQDVSQPGQGGADVRVGVVTDEPANGAQIGDGAEFGEGAFDGERRPRINQDPVRTVGNEIGVALEMVIRQTHSNPPHTGGNFDGLLLRCRRVEPGVRRGMFAGPMERTIHGGSGNVLNGGTQPCTPLWGGSVMNSLCCRRASEPRDPCETDGNRYLPVQPSQARP